MNAKLQLKLARAELRAALGMDDFEAEFVEVKSEQYARRLTVKPDGTIDQSELRALVKEIAATADARWKRKPLAGPTYYAELRSVLDAERKREAEQQHPTGHRQGPARNESHQERQEVARARNRTTLDAAKRAVDQQRKHRDLLKQQLDDAEDAANVASEALSRARAKAGTRPEQLDALGATLEQAEAEAERLNEALGYADDELETLRKNLTELLQTSARDRHTESTEQLYTFIRDSLLPSLHNAFTELKPVLADFTTRLNRAVSFEHQAANAMGQRAKAHPEIIDNLGRDFRALSTRLAC